MIPWMIEEELFFLEDAYTGLEYDTWQVHVGWKILNWSATEAFHPADILNARNFDSSLENAEKIGELMVHYTYILEEGTINFFYLPYIMLPNLPEPNNRLSFFPSNAIVGNSLIVDESGNTLANKWQPQWAFRFEYTLGDADISFFMPLSILIAINLIYYLQPDLHSQVLSIKNFNMGLPINMP
jgi:hypothetical protein